MTATKRELQRLIECCICCDYLNDVRETPCCHKLFCYSCIQSWLEKPTTQCPTCSSVSLFEQNLLENHVIQHFVDTLLFDCPNKLQGCSIKLRKCDLLKHKQTCQYSIEKRAENHRLKLNEYRNLLLKHRQGQTQLSEKILFDLANLFHKENDNLNAKHCLQMIKNTNNKSVEYFILLAQIEQDTNNIDIAIELYTKAYVLSQSILQRIELLKQRGHLLIKKADYEYAKNIFQQALDLLETTDKSSIKVEILNGLGLVAKKASDYDEAISHYTEAIQIVNKDSSLWSDIISNLADAHRKKGNYDEARRLYLESLKQVEAVYGQDHPAVADILNNLAILSKKQGDYHDALDYLKQALKIVKHYHGNDYPTIGIYLTNLGDIYRKQSDYNTAEAIYKEALSCLERAYGPNHIEVAEVLNSMGLVFKKRAEYDEAETYYKRAIQIIQDTFGFEQEHYKLGIYYNNLADLDRKRCKYDEALKLYQRALKSIEKTLGLQHSEAAEIYHNIGQVQYQLGNYQQSIDHINRALTIIREEFGDKHYKYGMYLNSLGLAYAMYRDSRMGYVHVKQAIQILINSLGSSHIEVCDAYFNLGDICMRYIIETKQKQLVNDNQSKLDEAKLSYLEALNIVQATFGNTHTKALQLQSLLFIVDNYNSLCQL